MAVTERLRFQQQHDLHDLRTHFFAHAAAMRHHQIVLELTQFLCRNGDVTQASEAGSDAIYRAANIAHLAVKICAATLDSGYCLLAQTELLVVFDNLLYLINSKVIMIDNMHNGIFKVLF